jgi:hypothetical protein
MLINFLIQLPYFNKLTFFKRHKFRNNLSGSKTSAKNLKKTTPRNIVTKYPKKNLIFFSESPQNSS